MNRLKLTRDRQERFLKVLADTGNVTAAVAVGRHQPEPCLRAPKDGT